MNALVLVVWLSFSPDTLLPSIMACGSDTERVNRLYERGFAMRHTDAAAAARYAALCLREAKRTGSGRHLAKALSLSGVIAYKHGSLEKSMRFHEEALKLRRATADRAGEAITLTNLGNVYSDAGRETEAESSYLAALSICNANSDHKGIARCLINLGALKEQQRNSAEAMRYFRLGLEESVRAGDYDLRGMCLNNLAVLYAADGQDEKAIAMHEDALKLKDMTDNEMEKADTYINLAQIYARRGEEALADDYLKRALSVAAAFDYREGLSIAAHEYSLLKARRGDTAAAYRFLLQSEAAKPVAPPDDAVVSRAAPVVPAAGKERGWWLLALLALFSVGTPVALFSLKR